jgi:hypothetical protein
MSGLSQKPTSDSSYNLLSIIGSYFHPDINVGKISTVTGIIKKDSFTLIIGKDVNRKNWSFSMKNGVNDLFGKPIALNIKW